LIVLLPRFYRLLCVFEVLNSILHGLVISIGVVDLLFNELDEVVDILCCDKVCLNIEIVQVLIEDVCEQVQVLPLVLADICDLDGALHTVHDLVAQLLIVAIVQGGGEGQSLTLAGLLQELRTVTHTVGYQGVEVLRPEAAKVEDGAHDQVDGLEFGL
jgi:hypothetical protein